MRRILPYAVLVIMSASIGMAFGWYHGRQWGDARVFQTGYDLGYNSGVTDAYVAYRQGGIDAVQIVVDEEEAANKKKYPRK